MVRLHHFTKSKFSVNDDGVSGLRDDGKTVEKLSEEQISGNMSVNLLC